jgi:hypothetical protein|tara:strand:+ start:7716 stop:7871 length:156 start_codon:yes stop_codon:yes gene_type:complete
LASPRAPGVLLLAVAVRSWRDAEYVHGDAAQVRDKVATPTALVKTSIIGGA